jgi:plastocyanin
MVDPSVTVTDQPIVDEKIVVENAVSPGPGWIVIHADNDGVPGLVLGHTSLQEGENSEVVVEVDSESRTDRLYAMLHTDEGEVGTYEFPGPDAPVTADGTVVVAAFNARGGADEMEAPQAEQENVQVIDFSFAPESLTVKAGTTVVWMSEASAPHTVTADDGSFDSGTIRRGDSFSYTFAEPGEYPYYCTFHGNAGGGGMAGTIVVTN